MRTRARSAAGIGLARIHNRVTAHKQTDVRVLRPFTWVGYGEAVRAVLQNDVNRSLNWRIFMELILFSVLGSAMLLLTELYDSTPGLGSGPPSSAPQRSGDERRHMDFENIAATKTAATTATWPAL
jgi:hypothetical protein